MADNAPIREPADLAKLIDHTLLKPDATAEQVRRLCAEAAQHRFYSVCVNPIFVALAHRKLAGSEVKTCSVIAFPFGATTTEAKVAETRQAVAEGAQEIDMVIAVGALKGGEVIACDSSEPLKVQGLAVQTGEGLHILIANLTDETQECALAPLGSGHALITTLDASRAPQAMAHAEEFRSEAKTEIPVCDSTLVLTLEPYSTLRIG